MNFARGMHSRRELRLKKTCSFILAKEKLKLQESYSIDETEGRT
jgi:hypothetical protein